MMNPMMGSRSTSRRDAFSEGSACVMDVSSSAQLQGRQSCLSTVGRTEAGRRSGASILKGEKGVARSQNRIQKGALGDLTIDVKLASRRSHSSGSKPKLERTCSHLSSPKAAGDHEEVGTSPQRAASLARDADMANMSATEAIVNPVE